MDVRWGVAGTGRISGRFADAMGWVDGGRIVAVGSRTARAAEEYGDRYGVERRHHSYDSLAADPEVDAVYIGTPHSRHETDAVRFLEAGKHVLCEKPMALSAAQVRRMRDAAVDHGRFLMEALWSRFLPSYVRLSDLLAEGRIGPIRQVEASFGFEAKFEPSHRLFDRALGGGALLDLGIYPLQLCSLVLGGPDRIEAVAHVGSTGVDEQIAALLHHPDGALGVVQASLRSSLRCDARIVGETGVIDLPAFMHRPDHLIVTSAGGIERIDAGWDGDGMQFQIAEVHRCLAAGLTESPVVPLDESLRLATTMDTILRQVGVAYDDA
ncbi:MAG: Gfo/Idh/MocA family oxidoreductase [Acidimicrobiales bacterium]